MSRPDELEHLARSAMGEAEGAGEEPPTSPAPELKPGWWIVPAVSVGAAIWLGVLVEVFF